MKRNIFVLAAFAASVLLMGCSGSSDGVTLKFNMAKGSKLDYNANLDMTIKETVMGTDMNITSKITLGYLFEVTGDSAGWKNLTSTITRIGMDMNAGGMAIKFDSDNPNTDTAGPNGMVAKIFGGMKGGQFSHS